MPDPESKMEPERTMMTVQNRLTELDQSVEELEDRVYSHSLEFFEDSVEELESRVEELESRVEELESRVEELESRVKELESHERTHKSMREQFAGAQARHVAKALGRWTWHDILVYDNLPQFGTGEYIDSMQTPNTNE